MFKKINFKSILIGLIIGMTLCNLTPIYAAIEEFVLYKADYNIVVNQNNYENTEYPILNYKGTTYVPLKVMSDILGIPTTWNAELKQVEIITDVSTDIIGKEDVALSETTGTTTPSTDIMNTWEENGLAVVEVNTEKFIEVNSIQDKLKNTEYNLFDYVSGLCVLQRKENEKLTNILEIKAYSNSIQPYKPYENEYFIGSGAFKLYIKYIDYENLIKPVIGE
jgi:predicted DNA-binding protein YlxM (UPF0122 family)